MTSTISPTLLVMAAGLGSRYGGLKQLDPVGTGGEAIMDYSIYDAIRAGFSKVVFVIRKDIEPAFREAVGERFSSRIAVDYVFQDPNSLPSGRTKPWGTAHAVLVAADAIETPFAVINADDFYGAHSFRLLAQHFNSSSVDYAVVAYPLRNTLSPFGTVSRGICEVDSSGYLSTIVERTRIAADGDHARNADPGGHSTDLTGDELVSMNIWGFTPSIFPELRDYFARFLAQHSNDLSAEAYLPSFVDELITAGCARVRVLQTADSWFGITYREDLPRVAASIRALIAAGVYPERLA
jgi:NDP-sugar pyrophosphorylase family protein